MGRNSTNKWVAERFSENAWRDEDVAMTTVRHVLRNQDDARTMLVGMIASEGWGFLEMPAAWSQARGKILLDMAERIARADGTDEVKHEGLVFRLRELNY